MAVGLFAFTYQGNGTTPCQYIDATPKPIDCATTLPLTVFIYETLQQTSRPLLSKLSERRQIWVFDPHFEEVRDGLEPWLMARWEARVDFLLTVIERLFLSLTVEALQGKTCQNSLPFGGVCQFEPRFQGKGSSFGYIFGLYKTRHILLSYNANCTVLRAVILTQYRRVTDGQTDRRNWYS